MSDLRVGVIGGSGLAAALSGDKGSTSHEPATPFGAPSGPIIEARWGDVPVFILARHGAGHTLPPSKVPYRANIFALKTLGVTHIFASGAVGSLREEFRPRDLVVADQVIDKTTRPATFYDNAAVHVEFAEPFCGVLREVLLDAATVLEPVKVHDGACYVAMEGPAFSTRAESLMHRLLGGDLIGMTAMPEAKLAREAEISYALLALVTDYDSWQAKPPKKFDPAAPSVAAPEPDALLAEIIANLGAASESAEKLMRRAVELLAERATRALQAPAQAALKRALWTDKAHITPAEVERLAPLWLKYLRPE